ncbi:hypothetical protein IWQ62_000980 [Dispira parvispora]|uniref:Uncharacterized protein n=1 Tax=Dispira parvispora TaxID=1520584 RepID=A0A9W8E9K7_9FUNG|nr:hypothetical protein IWQ62_000980 [Dispira parvispora]
MQQLCIYIKTNTVDARENSAKEFATTDIHSELMKKALFALNIYRKWLNNPIKSHGILLRAKNERFLVNLALASGLLRQYAIMLVICKENDPTTYYELIWDLNNPKYSAETLIAYHTRNYHFITVVTIPSALDKETTISTVNEYLKFNQGNIGNRRSGRLGKIVFYS